MILNKTKKIFLTTLAISSSLNVFAQNDTTYYLQKQWEAFPIVNYDTDVGFGYGAKGFLYNFLGSEESFDITIYNSTKGERWYQLIFSFPDKQRRHGKDYGSAFDFIIDYDKWIDFDFYTIRNNDFAKSTNTIEKYTREPIDISTIFSKTLTKSLIAESGFKYTSISCYDMPSDGTLKPISNSHVQNLSFLLNFLYDTRTDLIHPKEGFLLQLNNEFARDINGGTQSFIRNKIMLQYYFPIFSPDIILASRIAYERMSNVEFPNKLALGGNNTIRGIPQDRYISESYILVNEEFRIPIWWRFGFILGVDIGNSKSTPNWIVNSILGLRFYMDNFIVRADYGIGKNTTGFYFNFGHLF